MGGEGSGRWNDHDKRRTVEDAWALEIAAISLRGSLSYPLTGTARAIRVTGNRNVLPARYSLVGGGGGRGPDPTPSPAPAAARAIGVTGNRNVLPVRYSLVEGDEGPVLDLTYAFGQTFLGPGPTGCVGRRATQPARRWG